MKKYFFFFIVFVSLSAFWSCGSDSEKAAGILQAAENAVEQHPDSTLALLDSIQNPYELNREHHARYLLLLVQAKYKNDKDISNDTLIFRARNYFKKANDIKHWALAAFYSGRVLEARQKPQQALTAFLEAESIAVPTQDPTLIGFIQYNIGAALFQNGLYDDAIVKFKQAAWNFSQKEKDLKKEIMSLCFIGSNFVGNNNADSAFFYFNEALSKATTISDSTDIADILLNMGVTFIETGKTEEAKAKLTEALQFGKDSIQQAKINLNLARAYSDNNMPDSAGFYISRAIELTQKSNDKTLQASIFYYAAQIEEKNGNCKASLEHYKQYSDYLSSVYDEWQSVNFLEIQKKYDFELLQNAKRKLTIEKLSYALLFLIATLILSGFALTVSYKRKRDRETIVSAEQEIYRLKKIIDNRSSNETNSAEAEEDTGSGIDDKLREVLAKKFGIEKRVALLEGALPKIEREKGKEVLKRIYTIVYGRSDGYDWNVLINTINDLYDGFAEKLHAVAPKLKETEFRICCLSKAGLSNSEIAGLLNVTENAIQMRKTHLRKLLKMPELKTFTKELDKIVYKR
ncbi:MAG: hypothetical protein FWF53_06125 [Candidatus Azobacteroides sp.]|nr:hypothetical protein [Candidatus Azobacteroides sp.]